MFAKQCLSVRPGLETAQRPTIGAGVLSRIFVPNAGTLLDNGPVKLIEWVKIALLFLHVMSKMFQFTILNLSGAGVLYPSINEF